MIVDSFHGSAQALVRRHGPFATQYSCYRLHFCTFLIFVPVDATRCLAPGRCREFLGLVCGVGIHFSMAAAPLRGSWRIRYVRGFPPARILQILGTDGTSRTLYR